MSVLREIKTFVLALLHRIGLNGEDALVGVVFFLVSFFGSIALTGAVLVRLPPDYLISDERRPADREHLRAFFFRVLRYIGGVLLILIGLVLMLPGVPGQGVLTVIAGLFVSDLPGTRALLRRLLKSPRVLSAVNKLRARYKHPPLTAPEEKPN